MCLMEMWMNEFKPFEQPSKTKVAIVAGGQVETIPLDLDVYVGVDAGWDRKSVV